MQVESRFIDLMLNRSMYGVPGYEKNMPICPVALSLPTRSSLRASKPRAVSQKGSFASAEPGAHVYAKFFYSFVRRRWRRRVAGRAAAAARGQPPRRRRSCQRSS